MATDIETRPPPWAKAVKRRLLELGHSRRWLALQIGIDPSQFWRTIEGKPNNHNRKPNSIGWYYTLSDEQKDRIAKELEVSRESLFGRES